MHQLKTWCRSSAIATSSPSWGYYNGVVLLHFPIESAGNTTNSFMQTTCIQPLLGLALSLSVLLICTGPLFVNMAKCWRKATKAIFIQPPVYKHTFPVIVAIQSVSNNIVPMDKVHTIYSTIHVYGWDECVRATTSFGCLAKKEEKES